MGQPKIWNDSGFVSGYDANLADGDLKVVGTSTPYTLQVRQGGAWVNFFSQSVFKVNPTYRVLSADVESDATANVLVPLPEFAIAMLEVNPLIVHFRACILYSAEAKTTGSRWTVDGPTGTSYAYRSVYALSTTTETVNYCDEEKQPTGCNASSFSFGSNLAIIEGFAMTPSVAGDLRFLFASGVNNSAITALAGSVLLYESYRANEFE